MRPEPAKIKKTDQEQIGGVVDLIAGKGLPGIEGEYQCRGEEQYRDQQQGVIADGGEAPKKTRRGITAAGI